MATTEKQVTANIGNAKRSTGPTTEAGKAVVSQNALKHGVRSQRLLLEHEDPKDYQTLHAGLVESLKPVGFLEHELVDKIATILWRERRLLAAETASMNALQLPQPLLQHINSILGNTSWPLSEELRLADLQPPDEADLANAQQLKQELDESELDLENASADEIKTTMPLFYAELESWAQEEGQSVADYLANDGLDECLQQQTAWCYRLCKCATNYPLTQQVIKLVQAKAPLTIEPQAINDYHTRLDNQLYKALKALREAQSWRLEVLEAEPA